MADEILVKYKADYSAIESQLDSYTEKLRTAEKTGVAGVQKLATETNKLAKGFDEIGKKAVGAFAIDKGGQIIKTAANVQSLRAQFKEATNEVGRLTVQFGALDVRTLAAAKNAGSLKNQIGDINKQINALNPDANFNALIQVTQGVSGALFVAQGAMSLFGVESDKTKEILSKFVGAINLAQGLNQLGGLKSAFTSLASVLGISSSLTSQQARSIADVAKESVVSAESIKTAASASTLYSNSSKVFTGVAQSATVAQLGLNKAVSANPYVIAAIAVATLVSAFLILRKGADDVADKIKQVEDNLAFMSKDANTRKRFADEYIQELQGQIDLKKAQGAGDKEMSELQASLSKQKLIDLANEKEQLQSNFDANSAQIDEIYKTESISKEKREALIGDLMDANNKFLERQRAIPAEEAKIKNDILVIEADFTKKSIEESKSRAAKEAELAKQRQDAIAAFNFRMRQGEIDLMVEDSEKKRAILILEFDKETDALASNVDKKILTYKDFSRQVVAMQALLVQKLSALPPIPLIEIIDPAKPSDTPLDTRQRGKSPKQLAAIKKTEKELADYKADIINKEFQLSEDLLSGIQELENMAFQSRFDQLDERAKAASDAFDKEAEALEKRNERGSISDREYSRQKEILDKKREVSEAAFAKQQKKIAHDQAVTNKTFAIFNIILDTTQAIMKATASAPWPFNIPLIAFAAATGALQLAIAASAPVPAAYAKGTSYVKGEGRPNGIDTVPAYLTKGERVVTVEKNKKNWEIYEALDKNKFDELVRRKYVVPLILEMQKKQAEKVSDRHAQTVGAAIFSNMSSLTGDEMRKLWSKGISINNLPEKEYEFSPGKYGVQ